MGRDTCSILLASDLSACGDRALDRAIDIARRRRCKLIVLHVVEEPSFAERLRSPESRDAELQAAERLLLDTVGEVDVPMELIVETGHPVEVIERTARLRQCDLIVTGSGRNGGLGRLLLGSTAERLARTAALPILIVRKRPHRPYQRVLGATDFSEGSRQALNAARVFFPDAQLTLLHAYPMLKADPDPAEIEAAQGQAQRAGDAFVSRHFARGGAAPKLVLERGLPERVVPDYVARHPTDLLVVGTHGLTGLLRTAMGSVAERLIQLSPCDALVVRTVPVEPLA
ncbi:universal stress protein [Pigmentiphaga sp.]|uniref:universal stress protein n=1 Tax=Pigmentiphaga sp. TaxID=1977564 RepID=UPI0025D4884F|nr:universal stress protein [Pigmentiphaga sp.]MBX6317744.1 universal stress protein [Pigmentiphaga sp.]